MNYKEVESDVEDGVDDSDCESEAVIVVKSDGNSDREHGVSSKGSAERGRGGDGGGDDDNDDGDDGDDDDEDNDDGDDDALQGSAAAVANDKDDKDDKNSKDDKDDQDEDEDDEYDEEEEWILEQIQTAEQAKPQGWTEESKDEALRALLTLDCFASSDGWMDGWMGLIVRAFSPPPPGESLLHRVRWHRVILDEAHAIKDRSCNTAQAAFSLDAENRWALSGTPLQNRVGELYSIIRYMRMYPYGYYFCSHKVGL